MRSANPRQIATLLVVFMCVWLPFHEPEAGPAKQKTCWSIGGECMAVIPIRAPGAIARLDACFGRFLDCCKQRGTKVEPGKVNSPCVSNCKIGTRAFEIMNSSRSCKGLFAERRCAPNDTACRSRVRELLDHCTKKAKALYAMCHKHCSPRAASVHRLSCRPGAADLTEGGKIGLLGPCGS